MCYLLFLNALYYILLIFHRGNKKSYKFCEYYFYNRLKYNISSRYKGQLYICDCNRKGKLINREVWFMNCQSILFLHWIKCYTRQFRLYNTHKETDWSFTGRSVFYNGCCGYYTERGGIQTLSSIEEWILSLCWGFHLGCTYVGAAEVVWKCAEQIAHYFYHICVGCKH